MRRKVGRCDEDTEKFWEELTTVKEGIPSTDKLIVAGDLNGHIGKNREGFELVHEGHGVEHRNKEGERILDFGMQMDLVVCNSCFKKAENKLITYESGDHRSVLDYVLVRKADRKFILNTKTFAGEECVRQHRLVVCDMIMEVVL